MGYQETGTRYMLRSPHLFGSIILACVWYATFDFSDRTVPMNKITNSQPEVLTLPSPHPAIASQNGLQNDQCIKLCLLDATEAFSV